MSTTLSEKSFSAARDVIVRTFGAKGYVVLATQRGLALAGFYADYVPTENGIRVQPRGTVVAAQSQGEDDTVSAHCYNAKEAHVLSVTLELGSRIVADDILNISLTVRIG
jgi:hypothetical protein